MPTDQNRRFPLLRLGWGNRSRCPPLVTGRGRSTDGRRFEVARKLLMSCGESAAPFLVWFRRRPGRGQEVTPAWFDDRPASAVAPRVVRRRSWPVGSSCAAPRQFLRSPRQSRAAVRRFGLGHRPPHGSGHVPGQHDVGGRRRPCPLISMIAIRGVSRRDPRREEVGTRPPPGPTPGEVSGTPRPRGLSRVRRTDQRICRSRRRANRPLSGPARAGFRPSLEEWSYRFTDGPRGPGRGTGTSPPSRDRVLAHSVLLDRRTCATRWVRSRRIGVASARVGTAEWRTVRIEPMRCSSTGDAGA